jgi:hypothetical protein
MLFSSSVSSLPLFLVRAASFNPLFPAMYLPPPPHTFLELVSACFYTSEGTIIWHCLVDDSLRVLSCFKVKVAGCLCFLIFLVPSAFFSSLPFAVPGSNSALLIFFVSTLHITDCNVHLKRNVHV